MSNDGWIEVLGIYCIGLICVMGRFDYLVVGRFYSRGAGFGV